MCVNWKTLSANTILHGWYQCELYLRLENQPLHPVNILKHLMEDCQGSSFQWYFHFLYTSYRKYRFCNISRRICFSVILCHWSVYPQTLADTISPKWYDLSVWNLVCRLLSGMGLLVRIYLSVRTSQNKVLRYLCNHPNYRTFRWKYRRIHWWRYQVLGRKPQDRVCLIFSVLTKRCRLRLQRNISTHMYLFCVILTTTVTQV